MKPEVEIDVDEETGVWRTDGLPMLYIPRHFMVNVHNGIEAALGREHYRRVLADTGHRSAYYWCKSQAEEYNISGVRVVEHYLQRLSVRGWGQFHLEKLELDAPRLTIILKNSIYVLAREEKSAQPVCYMFEGFFTGAMQYLTEANNLEPKDLICREVACQSMGFDHCIFEVEIRDNNEK